MGEDFEAGNSRNSEPPGGTVETYASRHKPGGRSVTR
jgi:hypothetical protein